MRKDPKVVKELEAEQMFRQIKAIEDTFKPAPKNKKDLKAKPNAQGIETLINGCQQLLRRYPGTGAAQKAESLMND